MIPLGIIASCIPLDRHAGGDRRRFLTPKGVNTLGLDLQGFGLSNLFRLRYIRTLRPRIHSWSAVYLSSLLLAFRGVLGPCPSIHPHLSVLTIDGGLSNSHQNGGPLLFAKSLRVTCNSTKGLGVNADFSSAVNAAASRGRLFLRLVK